MLVEILRLRPKSAPAPESIRSLDAEPEPDAEAWDGESARRGV